MGLFEHALSAVKQADIVLEILDARFPKQTRNFEIEQKLLQKHKRLVFVLNKCDLIGKQKATETKKELSATATTVFVSANKKLGTTKLKKEIMRIAGKENVKVAVLGYPNTGKSSVINALAGRKAARTSAQAGFTRGEQFVRIAKNVLLIDSPGIIPFEQRSEFELTLIAAKSVNQLQDIEGTALELIEWLQNQNALAIKENFGIETNGKDSVEILEEIAIKKKRLLKGAKPDTMSTASMLIQDWQKGNIKI
jgi:ribosome biogenesis GTPase A